MMRMETMMAMTTRESTTAAAITPVWSIALPVGEREGGKKGERGLKNEKNTNYHNHNWIDCVSISIIMQADVQHRATKTTRTKQGPRNEG